jgi:hypothetical protein
MGHQWELQVPLTSVKRKQVASTSGEIRHVLLPAPMEGAPCLGFWLTRQAAS